MLNICLWWNGSGDRAAGLYTLVKLEVTGSIPGVSHKCRIVRIIIPACLIKQVNNDDDQPRWYDTCDSNLDIFILKLELLGKTVTVQIAVSSIETYTIYIQLV